MPLASTCLPLPFELERIISEIAARSHRPNIVNLVLVARMFQEWIEPILYERIILPSVLEGKRLLRTLNDTTRRDRARYIKALYIVPPSKKIFYSSHPRSPKHLIRHCRYLENFSYGSLRDDLRPSMLPIFEQHRLRRASLDIDEFFVNGSRVGNDFFHAQQSLTHLDIRSMEAEHALRTMTMGLDFSLLQHLTHLRFRFVDLFAVDDPESLEGLPMPILYACAGLQLLLLDPCDFETSLYEFTMVTPFDPRLVFLIDDSDPILDWEAPIQGQRDVWMRGEEHVRVQRANQSYSLLVTKQPR
ncbi:hypothetical protein PLICRDRAFT_45890 [Plicaturopsis crispa FD-325 SS-3]|uniref:F-box domain-containing protein n=1 Tax=Plicaturopsis crispa FD-325 SS-3 TaxID=944288 RepID=A0A0C9SRB9_PLICR|nr:hypothetical protein PLICRDRAFT_45890 [Plicaturopsis crispa FD-325 SS-3]